MTSTHSNGFQVLVLSIAVYGLLVMGIPVRGMAQSQNFNDAGSSDTGFQKDKNSDHHTETSGLSDAKGGNGGRRPPRKTPDPTPTLDPTPTPTPTPTPAPTPTPTPNPNAQWDIAGKQGVKFHTNRSDWYRVSAAELTANGFDTNTNSAKWQLYSNGNEVAMRVNADLSVEFFGYGRDALETDSNVYFLVNGNSNGMRVGQVPGGSAGQTNGSYSYPAKSERKDRMSYGTSILNGEDSNWFGSFLNSTPLPLEIDLKNLATSGQASIKVRMQGFSNVAHLVTVKVNNYQAGTMSYLNKANYTEIFNVPVSELLEGENIVTLQSVGGGTDYSLVDTIEISYPRTYKAVNNKLSFSVPAGETVRVAGFTESDIRVFELSGNAVASEVLGNVEFINGAFEVSLASYSSNREFIAVSPSGVSAPKKTETNTPSFWNQSSNGATFVIIAPPSLNSQAQALANRRISQGMQTSVVLTEDIGDEFGNGAVSAEAIRSFLDRANATWQLKPSHVLLFGDASYDMRNYLGGQDRNMVPTKLIETFDMETSGDGWMTDFNNDGVEDLAMGRLPVVTVAEADLAVAKIVRYETLNTNEPRSALLAADYWFETLNGELQNLLPGNASSQKVERATLGDAAMRSEVLNGADANPTVVTYLGHGTTGAWTTGQVLRVTDAANMTNQKLSFYMLMTCLNGFSHNTSNVSLAESLVMSQNGAIAVWASSGSTYASGQIEMSQQVMRDLFPSGNKSTPIGQIVRDAKMMSNSMDARRTWQLLGDPTVIIK